MNLAPTLKQLEKVTVDNSPAILTALGIAGVVGTAYLTGKAVLKAADIVERERKLQSDPLETKDEIKLVWKVYIPPVISGAVTCASIFGANRVSSRRAAAVATAYTLSERAFTEYKEKVIERVGEKKERAYRDEIAQERVDKDPVDNNMIVITDNGDVLCYDHFTGRYFKSSMESLKQAENDVNFRILHDGYANVSDLYEILGLPTTSFSDEVGWNTDRPLKLVFSTTMSEDNRPCISIDFDLHPNRKYAHFAGE